MDKAQLSRLLDERVKEKLKEGYSITTYALDTASRDRVKRGLKLQAHAIPVENHEAEEWLEYISQVEAGTYKTEQRGHDIETAPQSESTPRPADQVCGSSGLWKVRRH